MNATEYYDEIAIEFPPVWLDEHDWELVHDGKSYFCVGVIEELVEEFIDSQEAIIVLHSASSIAARLPVANIIDFISEHLFEGDIQITNNNFNSFVAIQRIGVATGWRAT